MRCSTLLVVLIVGWSATESDAATASFRTEQYEVTPEMVATGVPEGALIHDFFVTDRQ